MPYDYFNLPGFQSYTHPHLKPGFEDTLPLLHSIFKYIEQEKGSVGVGYAEILKNLSLTRRKGRFRNRVKTKVYKFVNQRIYPHWVRYFQPSSEKRTQIEQRIAQM